MLTPTLDKLPEKQRKYVNELFLNAAIAYNLGSDWKAIFRKAKNQKSGFIKRFSEFWLEQNNQTLEKAINIFFEA